MTENDSAGSSRPNKHLTITFTINETEVERDIQPSTTLLDLIRDDLGLKGTKPGCYEGECGACTVLVDGNAVNSCLYLAANVDGKSLTTIEGLCGDGEACSRSEARGHGAGVATGRIWQVIRWTVARDRQTRPS